MKSHTDREAARKRTVQVHDVHDIRRLTDTGAIAVPPRGAGSRPGDSRPRE